jgi:hypothetical protein
VSVGDRWCPQFSAHSGTDVATQIWRAGASDSLLRRSFRVSIHGVLDAARRRAPVIELLVQVEHAFGSCPMSLG